MEVEGIHEDVAIVNFHCEGGDSYVQEETLTKLKVYMEHGDNNYNDTIEVMQEMEEKETLGVVNIVVKVVE